MSTRIIPALGSVSGLLICTAVLASPWAYTLENTTRVEYYDVAGNQASSPYPYRHSQSYDELTARFSRKFSDYERVEGNVSLLFNDSAYRSSHQGVVPERLQLNWEKGDVGTPFRLQAGDIYPFLSLRTLQRPLKGSLLELQPSSGAADTRRSLLLFSGAGHDTYRDLDFSQDLYTGFSWLTENVALGNLAFNFVQNNRAQDTASGTTLPSRGQRLASLSGNTSLSLGHQLKFEGEVANATGDYLENTDVHRDTAGMGWFGQVRGETGTPLSYRLRYEKYDRDYHPNAATITPDHEGYEAHADWRLENGRSLRGRLQYFRDGMEAGNARDSRVAGIAMTGPLSLGFLPPMSLDLDTYFQNDEVQATVAQTRTQSARLNLGLPLGDWAGRLGLTATNIDESQPAAASVTEKFEASLGASHRYQLARFKGSIAPALVLRRTTTHNSSTDAFGPSLGLQLAHAGHQIGCNGTLLYQDADGGGTVSSLTGSLSANYRYSRGPHSFGLEAEYNHLDPANSHQTDSYRLAAFYTLHFDKPAGVTTRQAWASQMQGAPSQAAAPLAPSLVGQPLAAVTQQLQQQGISGAVALPDAVIFEARLLDELSQRQRLALVHREGLVTQTVLIIDFDDLRDARTVRQTYDQARALLIARFGRPGRSLDRGEFTTGFEQDINAGRLVRVEEWHTAAGYVRFGIPQRLDRQIRMELHSRNTAIDQNESYWSLEEAR